SADDVEQRRGVLVVGDRLERIDAIELRWGDQRQITGRRLHPVLAVADRAFLRVDRSTLRRRTAAGRQAGAVGQDIDVPGGDIGLADWLAEARRFGDRRAPAENECKAEGKQRTTRRHA